MRISKCLALGVGLLCLIGTATHAASIGAGVGIVDLEGADNAVDTPTDGSNDQSRQNIDISFTQTFGAGTYSASSWSFRAGQTGSVIPYVAKSTGDKVYEVLAVGTQVDIGDGDLDMNTTVPFGGESFTLDGDTELFAGIVNPKEIGSQNPIYTNLASGSFMDHDNNADGMLSEAVVGGTVDGLGHTDLARSYAFSIEIVPEPSSAVLMMIAAAVAALTLRRR